MDCRTALEILDAVRPDSADRMEPEVVSASEHVEKCRRCEDQFLARRHFDRRLGERLRDVPVPAGLKSRLLAELQILESPGEFPHGPQLESEPAAENVGADSSNAVGDAPVDLSTPDSVSARRGRRRARVVALAATALALMVAVTFFVVQSGQAPVWTMAELRHETATAFQGFEELPRFDGRFEARLPELGWETSRAISIVGPPHGFPAGTSPHSAALYHFRLHDGRRPPLDGVLLVTPKHNIAEPPQNTNFNADGVGSGPLSTVAWTEGEFVYVCVIRGGGDGLQRLERALQFTQAA